MLAIKRTPLLLLLLLVTLTVAQFDFTLSRWLAQARHACVDGCGRVMHMTLHLPDSPTPTQVVVQ